MLKTYAIILASGTGARFGGLLPKQFIKIGGKTMLEHTIEKFEKSNVIQSIIVVITPGYVDFAKDIITKNKYKKVVKVIEGGKTRKDSSFNGISAVEEHEAKVLIHDCARIFVSQEIISNCIKELDSNDAVTVAIPSVDTLIMVKDNKITKIPNRNEYQRVQTPQGFKLSVIKKAHLLSDKNIEYTDDCALVLANNLAEIYVISGNTNNIKITYPEDIKIAEEILAEN